MDKKAGLRDSSLRGTVSRPGNIRWASGLVCKYLLITIKNRYVIKCSSFNLVPKEDFRSNFATLLQLLQSGTDQGDFTAVQKLPLMGLAGNWHDGGRGDHFVSASLALNQSTLNILTKK